jgi:hypothetical protein
LLNSSTASVEENDNNRDVRLYYLGKKPSAWQEELVEKIDQNRLTFINRKEIKETSFRKN